MALSKEMLMLIRNNADARNNPQAVAYIIDSPERKVYNREERHRGEAVYIEKSGLTRAIYHTNSKTARSWGNEKVHYWLDAVHEGLRERRDGFNYDPDLLAYDAVDKNDLESVHDQVLSEAQVLSKVRDGRHLTEAHIKQLQKWEQQLKRIALDMVTQLPFITKYSDDDYKTQE